MDFGNLQKGKAFKMSATSSLTYIKENKKEAQCVNHTHGVILSPEQKVYPTRHAP